MAEHDKDDAQTLSSVSNAARLLQEFAKGDRSLGVSELSRRLGLGKSTTHRLLHTLTRSRLLEQDPITGGYRLGLAIYELGAAASRNMDMHTAATPVLDQFRQVARATVQVAILDGREVVYVERRESSAGLRLFGRVGHRNSAHCTSTGKVLLAYLPPEQLDERLDGWELDVRTPSTITDVATLRAELATVRHDGWAVNYGESEKGVVSVAAPIRNQTGQVIAALSMAGAGTDNVPRNQLAKYAKLTIEAADAISRRLGWQPIAVEGRQP